MFTSKELIFELENGVNVTIGAEAEVSAVSLMDSWAVASDI